MPHHASQETADLAGGDDIYLVTEDYMKAQNRNVTLNIIDNSGDNIVVIDNGLTIEEIQYIGQHTDVNTGKFLPSETNITVTRDDDERATKHNYFIRIVNPDKYTLYQEGEGNVSLFELVDYTAFSLLENYTAEVI